MPSSRQENLEIPTQFRCSEQFGGFFPFTSDSGQEIESRKLRWGDVQLQQDKDGEEMLVWLAERGTKTHHGQEKGHRRAFQPKVSATKTERFPVKFYKTFKSHRPVEMNQSESPFYLAVRQNRSSQDQV